MSIDETPDSRSGQGVLSAAARPLGPTLADLIAVRVSRRGALQGLGAAAAVAVMAPVAPALATLPISTLR